VATIRPLIQIVLEARQSPGWNLSARTAYEVPLRSFVDSQLAWSFSACVPAHRGSAANTEVMDPVTRECGSVMAARR